MSSTPPILTVIPCLNEAANIERLVAYLLVEHAHCPMQIVIADGGSTDGTVDIATYLAAKHHEVDYLHNPKRIQSAAINLAVATFGDGKEFLIRIDAHADYPKDFCRDLVKEAVHTNADSVVVAMHTLGKHGFQMAVAAAQNSRLGNGGASHRLKESDGKLVDHGHHALVKIASYRAIGGYDESFSHNEDAEFDVRLHKAGYVIWLTGKTSLNYYPRAKVGALFRQYRHYGRGRARTMLTHRQQPKLRQLLPVLVLPAMLCAACSALILLTTRGSIGWLFALPLLVWAGVCIAYGMVLAVRAKQVLIVLSGPAAMVMHAGWSMGFWQALLVARVGRKL